MARKSLTDRGITALRPRAARYAFADPQLAGLYVRVTPLGAKSFACVGRNPDGRQVWTTLGLCERMPIEEARSRAREALQRVRDGLPAIAPRGETFGQVSANWFKRHVEANGLRTAHDIRRQLDRYVLPGWSDRAFTAIKRSDIAELLDRIEDHHGPRQADCILALIRSVMNWAATRLDDYRPPVAKGMRRQSPSAQARARVLNDDELRRIWTLAESSGTFGAFVRLALLTAQRRGAILRMRWDDIAADGTWSVPKESPREKGNVGSVVLPDAALAIIREQPRLASNAYVLAGRGDGPFNGMSKAKERFAGKLENVEAWTVHDLRRTARSLMSRAGVSGDIAERILGHVQPGVRGVYDRHGYEIEKADALARLASLIAGIVNPPAGNVTLMHKRAKRQ